MQKIEGLSMGGTWSVSFGKEVNAVDLRALVQTALDTVEEQMSAWRPDSTLNKVNAAPIGEWVELPKEMAAVVGAGLGLMQEMPGVFSILLGGASAQFGFVPGKPCDVSADPGSVEFDGNRLRRRANVALDLNAIAKGYAADLATASLVAAGARNFLVEVAGDICAHGDRADGTPWTVAIELPVPDRMIPARSIPLTNAAIATSGGYRRFRGEASHLISPASKIPLPANGASVTVIADTALQADGWATAMALLGPKAGLEIAEKRGLSVVFVEPDPPEGFIERGSAMMAHGLANDI